MNTPRTDTERRRLKKAKAYPPDPVSADFARQLETELAAMTALADRLAKQLQAWVDASGNMFFQEDVEALASYETHKQKQHE